MIPCIIYLKTKKVSTAYVPLLINWNVNTDNLLKAAFGLSENQKLKFYTQNTPAACLF